MSPLARASRSRKSFRKVGEHFQIDVPAVGTWDLTLSTSNRIAVRGGLSIQQAESDIDVGSVAFDAAARLDVTFARDPSSLLQPASDDASLLIREAETRLALASIAPGMTLHLALPAARVTAELRRHGVLLDTKVVELSVATPTSLSFDAR